MSPNSLRLLHRRALTTAFLILIVVAITMVAPTGARFVMPGPLTDHHSAFWTDCGQCHVGADGVVKPLLHGWQRAATTDGVPTAALRESELCGNCHDLGAHALRPHSAPVELLAATTRAIQNPHDPAATPAEVACSSCHREHQGRAFDLTAVTNERCQSCHSQSFESFASDHPELGDYPYARRTRIIFDHARHRARYFPEQEQEFSCDSCHELDATGRYMVTRDFEAACASCHAEQIHGAGRSEPGIAFLQLPGVDVESLEAAGYDCGDWPATAADMIDFPLSPFVGALLAGDARYPEWEQDRHQLASLDLYELEDASDAQLAAAARLVTGVRRLVDDLATSPLAELEARFTASLGEPGQGLVDHIALPEFTAAQRWFGDSDDPSASASSLDAARVTREEELRGWGRRVSGAWYRLDEDFAISYQPTGHKDPFLRAWIDAAVGSEDQALQQLLLEDDGRCTKCHSVDRSLGAPGATTAYVNWRPFTTPGGRAATRFRHAPHLPLSGDSGCASCHVVRGGDGYLPSFALDRDVSTFVPEFSGMTKEQCLPCHEDDNVGGGCMRCHSYHVGDFPPARVPAPSTASGSK